jgi:hypothetical protein
MYVCMYLCMRMYVYGKGKKAKLSLCLTKHHAMKTYGVEVQLHAFFDLGA